MKNLVIEEDYYIEEGRIVLTEKYHKKRGRCCGAQCKHCPFVPQYKKGSTNIKI